MKTYYQTDNIGTAKYTISKHNGKDFHKDGSPFFDIAIFKNKPSLASYVAGLVKRGYVERNSF